jgi:putative amidoligase enzyme
MEKTLESWDESQGWVPIGTVGEIAVTLAKCVNCAQTSETLVTTPDTNEQYCAMCYEDNYSSCHGCEEDVRTDSMSAMSIDSWAARTSRHRYCQTCSDNHSFSCVRCNTAFDMRHTSEFDLNDDSYCQRCYENVTTSCHSCDEVIHVENAVTRGSYSYCTDCRPSGDSEAIYAYDYKPTPIFHGVGTYFGVELEVVAEETEANTITELMGEGHVYCKADGSVDDGFEIVTHPHSKEEHYKLWKPFFRKYKGTGRLQPESCCGMHVHVGRKGLSTLQIQKTLVFLNAPENLDFVVDIAQRSEETYAKIYEKKIGERLRVHREPNQNYYDPPGRVTHVTPISNGRYEALNLENSKTIEFRIFASTMSEMKFFKNLEFCDAVLKWVNRVSYRELRHKDFIAYIDKNRKEYPNLYQYLCTKNWLKAPKPIPATIKTKELAKCA